MRCEICKSYVKELHEHHIVPKSRGGTNESSNLIKICVDCHSKAHNVSFKGVKGLISDASKQKKEQDKYAKKWLEENKKKFDDFILNVYDKNPEKAYCLIHLMNTKNIGASDLVSMYKNKRLKFRGTIDINID